MTGDTGGYYAPPGAGKKFERDPDRPGIVKASGEDTGGAFAEQISNLPPSQRDPETLARIYQKHRAELVGPRLPPIERHGDG